MKNLIVLSAISIGLTTFIANAEEQNGFYVTGKLGTSILNMSDQKDFTEPTNHQPFSSNGEIPSTRVFSGGISLGYDFLNKLDLTLSTDIDLTERGEGVSIYNKTPVLDGSYYRDLRNKIPLTALMVNTYDFKNKSLFTPYVLNESLGYISKSFMEFGRGNKQ